MTTIGLILVLSSCVMHATWNALSKRAAAVPALFFWAGLSQTVLGLPVAIALWPAGPISPTVWACLGVSGVSLTVYYVGLSRAYRTGEMSFVYPLARSTPVLALVAWEYLHGIKHDWMGLGGVALIVAGSAVLPLRARGPRGRPWRHFLTPAAAWAMITAAGTVGYSVSDKMAVEALRGLGANATAWYLILEFTAATLLLWRVERPFDPLSGWRQARARWTVIVGVAVLTQLTYFLILLAMRDNKVSYVVAARQFSIVVATAMGVTWLGERQAVFGRVAGSLTITAGLILTALSC